LPFCVPIPSDSYQFKHIGKYWLMDKRRDFENPIF
jgi:hypothetical protein